MTIDIKELETLLEKGDYAAFRERMQDLLASPLSSAERAAGIADAASLYLDVMNAINGRYRDALNEAVTGLRRLKALESSAKDKMRIYELKQSMKQ